MSKTVLIGCRLPSGITLDGSLGQRIDINGLNTSMIQGGVGLTHVPDTEWLYLKESYKEHSAFKSQAVFAYKSSSNVADVMGMAADLAEVKTGLEGIDPSAPDKNLKPEDPGKLKQELNKNAGVKPAAKTPANVADQVAAMQAATGLDN